MARLQKRTLLERDTRSPETLALDIMKKGIHDERLLEAFTRIRREMFIPHKFLDQAYKDRPIIIGHDQVTTQPSLVAHMVQALKLTGREKVLEIGTGFGFQTAILASLCQEVFSVERYPELAMTAQSNLDKAGVRNVHVIIGDGTLGLPQHAPFDAIIVSAAAPKVPPPLMHQLRNEGTLIQPIGFGGDEIVTSFQKRGGGFFRVRAITGACFVPLVGNFGV